MTTKPGDKNLVKPGDRRAVYLGNTIAVTVTFRLSPGLCHRVYRHRVYRMAHHIADLMTKAANATGNDKISAEKECFSAILTLWKHRSEFPDGKRPYEDLEPVMRAIKSLDPDSEVPRYYHTARPPKSEALEQSDQAKWLEMVDGLDYTAKILIGHCLAEAATGALDKSKEWVKLAEAANAEDDVPQVVIQFISSAAFEKKQRDPDALHRELPADRLRRLQGFMKIAETVVNILTERLEALPPPKEREISDEVSK